MIFNRTVVLLRFVIFTILANFFITYSSSENAFENSLPNVDYILVMKEKRTLELYSKKKLVKSYKIALGFNPVGHKEQEGDGKTPEGKYSICWKNFNSQYYRSLKISYPAPKDKKNAAKKGVDPGSDIMIHGLGKKLGYIGKDHTKHDWTLGCIALTNEEILEIYQCVKAGTCIEIKP